MVHGNEGPIGDHTSDTDSMWVSRGRGRTGDEIFNSSGVKELDVRERENFREESGCEEGLALSIVAVTRG